jgi:hypothetical protein
MDEKVRGSWQGLLNPDVLRPSLIAVSLYIAAFEILKNTIIDEIKGFYTFGFDENGWRTDAKYQSEVLTRNRSPVYASLDWLKESKAIGDDDLAAFELVKEFRNRLAHELTTMLGKGLPPEFAERFTEMVSLVDKISRWWIVNVEIPTNPDLDGEEIDEQGIISGPIMGLRLMLDVALGSDKESRYYLEEFNKRTKT